jgi:hypothetical protein
MTNWNYALRTRIILAGAEDEEARMAGVPMTLISALALGVEATLLAGVAVAVVVGSVRPFRVRNPSMYGPPNHWWM